MIKVRARLIESVNLMLKVSERLHISNFYITFSHIVKTKRSLTYGPLDWSSIDLILYNYFFT